MPWYWLGARTYDPVLERFLQPDPASQPGVPDYVYARNDPLDLTDPTGLAGVPAGCASSGYVSQGQHFAACEGAGYAQQRAEQTNAALWAPANFLLLDPARNAFGPGKSLFDRGFGLLALAPFVGWAGHGIGLLADVGRGLTALRAADETVTVADEAARAGGSGGSEIFYRAMSNKEFANLWQTGELAPRGESFVTQSLDYVQDFAARSHKNAEYDVLVGFEAQSGTRQALIDAGARKIGQSLPSDLMRLPELYSGMRGVVNIKLENGAITYGLRPDSVSIFNERIISFSGMPVE